TVGPSIGASAHAIAAYPIRLAPSRSLDVSLIPTSATEKQAVMAACSARKNRKVMILADAAQPIEARMKIAMETSATGRLPYRSEIAPEMSSTRAVTTA